MMNYIPLYVRSEYSILESCSHMTSLLDHMQELGYDACAITDEGSMHGVIKFYQQAKKRNIKPIIGLALDYSINGVTSKILLYAMDMQGYRNLMRLSSRYKIFNKPVEIGDLHNLMGIIAVTPGEYSIINLWYERKQNDEIVKHLNFLKDIFNNVMIGISINRQIDKETLNSKISFFNSINYRQVAICPCFYLNIDDVDAYQVLKSIKNGGNKYSLDEGEKNAFLLTKSDVGFLFQEYPELLENTNIIKNKCNIELKFGEFILPKYDENINAADYLLKLCIAGLKKRILKNNIIDTKPYVLRLKKELNTIEKMGFADYFLIVWDYVKYAKTNHIMVGPGRGSAGASLVAYCLGITEIDPIKYNLLFERFLNEERITMPDIDIDFPDDKRELVIKYVGEKYSKNRVAHIATFGTFQIKLAINECARVLKLPENRLKQIIKYVIMESKDNGNGNQSLFDIINNSDSLKQLMAENADIDKVLRCASKIYGLPRNISTHAAGVIITKYDLINYTALDNGLDGIYQTQLEASDLEALGLLKMDFLGLKNLSNISTTIDLIKKDNPNFSLPTDENDRETYAMLASGDVSGVFQLESAGMRKVIMQMKVSSIDDITQALALYRPGPMEIIPTFIKRKFKEESVNYPHQDLKEILEETYGTIVYQEQIMQIAQKFAGYTLGRADILRRAVSKKKKDVLEKERLNFVASSINKGYSKEIAENIYDYIVKFADYGFNKAHSVAYAKVAYLTAYLKCHYLSYYLSPLMTSSLGNDNAILLYYKEALKKKIKAIGPSIFISELNFTSFNGSLVFPLTIIKGLGAAKADALIAVRNNAGLTDFKDFVIKTKNIIASSILENLIYSGALDDFGLTKRAMIESYRLIIDGYDYQNVIGIKPVTFTTDEYSYGILLEKEKDVLGINIKYNFFTRYSNLYLERNLQKISQAAEGKRISTMGIISDIKEIKTKNNESMAFANLSDDISNIEITIFPSVYNLNYPLKNGIIVMINGVVQNRNKLQIVVERIDKL